MNNQFEDMFGSNNEGKYVLANIGLVAIFVGLIALAVAIINR